MDWQMIGAVAAVVVPVGGLIVGLVVMSVNRQFDLLIQKLDRQFESVNRQFDAVNQQFDVLRAENRAAHAQIGANVDGLRGDVAGVRATLDALLLKLVPPAGSRVAGRREGEARR